MGPGVTLGDRLVLAALAQESSRMSNALSSVVAAPQPEVFEKVRSCFVEALGVEPEEVTLKSRVIDALGPESLDFLDIAYRLEQQFKIKIPRGDIKQKS